MESKEDPGQRRVSEPTNPNTLENEQSRWELEAKRRLMEEVLALLQQDRTINSSVARVVESMATLAERDPGSFWSDRSTSSTAQARLQLPFPPIPPFPPFPPIPPFPNFPPIPLPPIPAPGDIFGQVVDLIKAEKQLIQDLITKLLK